MGVESVDGVDNVECRQARKIRAKQPGRKLPASMTANLFPYCRRSKTSAGGAICGKWRSLGGSGVCGRFALHPDVDSVISHAAQVLYFVLDRREPPGLAMDSVHFSRSSILVGELKISVGEVHHYACRVLMQGRLFMRPIVDIHNLHPFIFKGQFVMRRFDLDWVLRKADIRFQQGHQDEHPEYLGEHENSP